MPAAVAVGPRLVVPVRPWPAVAVGPLLAIAVGPLLAVAVGPPVVSVRPLLVIAVGPPPVITVGPRAAAAGGTRLAGNTRPVCVAGPGGWFVAFVLLAAVAPGVPGIRRLVAFGFHHPVVGSRRCSRICAADGFVSAVPFGRTTVGTVWLPPLTDITYSAESGSRSMSTSVTSIPSRASWLFNRRQ